MNDIELFFKGALAGLAISAPIGPVNVLCISRTVLRGRRGGLISGLGAATADTVYGTIAGFSIQFIIQFVIREESWIRMFGGILLIAIGVFYFVKRPPSLTQDKEKKPAHSDYISALILNFTNPTVVLSFLAVLAALGLGHHKSYWSNVILVAGVFAGAMLWWTALALTADHFRNRFDSHAMLLMNRIAGVAIAAFGMVMMLLSRLHSN